MWSISQLLSRFNKNRKGAEETSSVEPSPSSDYLAALAASRGIWDTGREPPLRLDEELTIQAMYKSWVELESDLGRAHDNLRTILSDRERAATLRKDAEQVLLEGEAMREEARRIGEIAWQAFDRGFAINPRGLATHCARLREVEEAMKTQAALQRASHRETWDEADKTRQKATADLIRVLIALRTAVVQVERELHEAANLPAVAESLKEAAQEELRGAEAIRNELTFLGQEALNLLGTEPREGERPQDGLPAPEPRRTSLGPEERQVAFTPGTAETPPRLEGRITVHPAQEPQELQPAAEEGVAAATSVAWESVETQPDRAGYVEKDAASQPEPVPEPAIQREEPEENIIIEIPQQPVQPPEPPPSVAPQAVVPQIIEMPSESPAATASEELRRELEAISRSGPIAQDMPPLASDAPGEELGVSAVATEPVESRASSAAEELSNELAALTRLDRSAAPAPGEVPPSIGLDPLSPGLDQGEATPGSADLPGQSPAVADDHPGSAGLQETMAPDPAGPLPLSYTGRFFLMFPASLSQDSLESVWESLEEAAGPGSIADMRLVSRDAGVQFTMEVGAKELDLDELRRRLPNAELVPLGTDRLRVNWSG